MSVSKAERKIYISFFSSRPSLMLIHKNHVSGNGSTNDIYLMPSLVSFYLTQLLFIHINPEVSRFQCFYFQSRSLLGKIIHEIDWNWVRNGQQYMDTQSTQMAYLFT